MRLITRADLDGLTSAILLQEVVPVERVDFAHPKDVQDSKVEIGPDDILANLPYDSRAGLWFDHHLSQMDHGTRKGVKGKFLLAPSAARVIADYYRSPRFERYARLLEATDRLDAAQLTHEDVASPQGWVLVGFTLDPRSGLGAFKTYFLHLMELAKTKPIEEILSDPIVRAHADRLHRETAAFERSLRETSRQDGNVIFIDVRGLRDLPSGNRFLVYDLYPDANVSVRLADGHDGTYVAVQIGRSIFNRTCRTNIGELMARYGGGGHEGAGTCQPPIVQAERVIGEIVEMLKRNG